MRRARASKHFANAIPPIRFLQSSRSGSPEPYAVAPESCIKVSGSASVKVGRRPGLTAASASPHASAAASDSPCPRVGIASDPDTVHHIVLRYAMTVSANARFDELKTTGKLPSPSGVALAIIELCRKDGVSVAEIAHAVGADPALSGRILKFANAAANAPRRPIVSVPEAIQLVGINTVRQLVLGFSLLGQYRTGACTTFDYTRYWSRSLAVAIAAGALCLRVRSVPPDEAFTCGLLSDVGTLALATIYPDEYAELVS